MTLVSELCMIALAGLAGIGWTTPVQASQDPWPGPPSPGHLLDEASGQSAAASATQITINHLTPATEYCAIVWATNVIGDGPNQVVNET